MEAVNARIRELRKALRLSQEKFGEIIGISKSGVCDIEAGRRRVTNTHLLLLSHWRHKKINIQWLQGGDGEMFQSPDTSILAFLSDCDPFIQALFKACLKLEPSALEVLKQAAYEFSRELAPPNPQPPE